MEKLPERLLPINWDHYKHNVREEDIRVVCNFEERYKILEAQIPFPVDEEDYTEKIDCIKKEYKQEVAEFQKISGKEVLRLEAEKERIKNMMPFEEMTLEDFRDNWPERALDSINNPTFWPHDPAEQGLPDPPEHKVDLKAKALSLFSKDKKKKTA